ncbi:S-layer homology domain-containing protein [Leucobacter sp. 7(1)]|uniref:S-layer homology domain-containing protein n=1 Tax=Leucobacter sp. 7(1) TaxID=1255613 RepID=UPI00111E6D27|nr:S-layer homology domain-containing protein [Leucobacter sp. 7(1)]
MRRILRGSIGVLSSGVIAMSALTFAPQAPEREIVSAPVEAVQTEALEPVNIGEDVAPDGEPLPTDEPGGEDVDGVSDGDSEPSEEPSPGPDGSSDFGSEPELPEPVAPSPTEDAAPDSTEPEVNSGSEIVKEAPTPGPVSDAVPNAAATCKASEPEKTNQSGQNDSLRTATKLTLGTGTCGRIGTTNDKDYYKFESSAGTHRISFSFDSPQTPGNAYKVWAYDSSQRYLASWNLTGTAGNGGWISKQLTRFPSGTSYIAITPLDNKVVGKKYTLSVAKVSGAAANTPPSTEGCLAEGEKPDGWDENDSTYRPDPLPLGATLCGYIGLSLDKDFYQFGNGDGRYGVTFKFDDPKVKGNAYKVWLYDGRANFVKSWNLTGSAGNGTWLAKQISTLSNGGGYIAITPLDNKVVGKKYTLSVAKVSGAPANTSPNAEGCLAEGEKPDGWDENDSTYRPDPLPLGATLCGYIGLSLDKDFYSVNAEAGLYRVKISFGNAYDPASTDYYTVAALNSKGDQIKRWAVKAGDWRGKTVDVRLPRGIAYVSVIPSSEAFIGEEYRLTVTLLQKDTKPAFVDVPKNHKFFTEIEWMRSTGRTTGVKTSQGLAYQPQAAVSREAMAAFLFRQSAPKSFKAPRVSPFVDVPTNHKFYREISWMAQAKISTGVTKNGKRYYEPRAAVSREAMAAFLYRLQGPGSGKAPAQAPFVDVPRSHKFAKEIAWMRSSGISTGSKSAKGAVYQPKGKVSREAMAAFLYRAAQR